MKWWLTLPFRLVWVVIQVFGDMFKELGQGLGFNRPDEWYRIDYYGEQVVFNLKHVVSGGVRGGYDGHLYLGPYTSTPLSIAIHPAQWDRLWSQGLIEQIEPPATARAA